MPRVSAEHLERRRQQILDGARICFVRRGFHETSMQDIFRESGLSAGAVYRYFKSKDEIIRAIVAYNQGLIGGLLGEILGEETLPPLEEVMSRFAGRLIAMLGGPDGALRIAPQGWAQAVHDKEFAPIVRELFSDTRQLWIKLAVRLRDDGRLAPDADPEAVGAMLLCLMPGFILQYLLLDDVDERTVRAGIHGLVAR
ncbi:TetR/AcrR family transcriptional regulator [Actinomadura scrupuli]|uniref:TetR/AcrR family transcriptional regulator n=1 Tax=Actinomadura scrupuli TaxID=559629 RepID=UPI003D994D4D